VSLYFGAYSRLRGFASILEILNIAAVTPAVFAASSLNAVQTSVISPCDYNVIMKLDLVRIGNSRGIRIPKAIINQLGFEQSVDLRIERNRLVIAPARSLRQGWQEAFEAVGPSKGDDVLFYPAMQSDFDREEWEW
jgi:antitoxin MazE